MRILVLALTGIQYASAYPWVMEAAGLSSPKQNQKRAEPSVRQPLFLSNRKNTGRSNNDPTFNAAAQHVDVTSGSGHDFHPPGTTDKRGPCPGLNAAANHGFIPRNGILTTAQAISGLAEAFNVGSTFAIVGSVLGIVYGGDFVSGTWSIGGSYAALPLLSNPLGLLGTHSKYEGDGSPTRGDAYLNGGNTNVLFDQYFTHLYTSGSTLTHDNVAAHAEYVQQYSKQFNPYFFLGPVGAFLSPGTNGLVVNMMSNHSAENPGGFLNTEVLKTFYSVVGEPGNFVWIPGHERIPDNWYKRPSPLEITDIILDALENNAMYPGQISIGGNTGTVNTFTGVDLGNLTGGVFNAVNLLEGNNLACFLIQATQQAIPGQLSGIISDIGALVQWFVNELQPVTSNLNCPELAVFRKEAFAPFPGAASYLS